MSKETDSDEVTLDDVKSPGSLRRKATLTRSLSMSQRSLNLSFMRKKGESGVVGSTAQEAPSWAQGRSFAHKLPPAYGTNYFQMLDQSPDPFEEVESVNTDMVACCALLEEKGLNPASDTLNGTMQTMLQQPLKFLGRPKTWEHLKFARDSCIKSFVHVAYAAGQDEPTTAVEKSANSSSPAKQQQQKDLLQGASAKLQPVGGSFLDAEKALMVHMWVTTAGARAFLSGWTRTWQALFEHRIEGIHAPITVLYVLEGTYVSVTALPPLVSKTYAPFHAPGPAEECGTYISFAAHQLLHALHVSEITDSLQLHYAADGRFYIMSLAEILSPRLKVSPDKAVRIQVLRRWGLSGSHLTMDDYYLKEILPKIPQKILTELRARKTEENNVENLVQNRVIIYVLHSNGVNVANLNEIYLQLNLYCDDGNHVPIKMDDETGVQILSDVELYRIARDVIMQEMVQRSVKSLLRLDLTYGAGTTDEEARLHAINRMSRQLVSSEDFWKNHLLPQMRQKFKLGKDFVIDPKKSRPSLILKHLASKFGCEFSSSQNRFTQFALVGAVWLTLFDAQDIAYKTWANKELEDMIVGIWDDAKQLSGVARDTFFMRAACLSLVSRNCADKIHSHWEELKQDNTVAAVQFAGMEAEQQLTEKNFVFVMENKKFLEALTHPTDLAFVSHRLLQMGVLLLGSKNKATPLVYSAALRTFTQLPWIDLTYSAPHTQALREIESELQNFDIDAVEEYLGIAEVIVNQLQKRNRLFNAARYMQRVLSCMVGYVSCESSPSAGRFSVLNYTTHVAAHGRDDGRTCLASFYMALFCLTCAKERSLDRLVFAVRRAITQIQILPRKAVHKISSGNSTLSLLHKVTDALSTLGDRPASATLAAHVSHFGKMFVVAAGLQRVGRGYKCRENYQNWKQMFASLTLQTEDEMKAVYSPSPSPTHAEHADALSPSHVRFDQTNSFADTIANLSPEERFSGTGTLTSPKNDGLMQEIPAYKRMDSTVTKKESVTGGNSGSLVVEDLSSDDEL